MDRETLGIIAFPFLFVLLAFRVPIGLAMLIVGSAGTAMIAGWLPIFSQVKTSAWHLFSNYSLSVIPLFLLMGNLASRAGMSEALFKFASACLGHRKGGVAMAAVGACAGFGAICGSSLATAATMGTMLSVASVTIAMVMPMAMGIFARILRAGTRGLSSRMISSLEESELIALVEPIISRVSPGCRRRLSSRSR